MYFIDMDPENCDGSQGLNKPQVCLWCEIFLYKKQFIQLTGIENWTKTLLQVAFGTLVCIFQFPSSAAHTTCYKFLVKGDASMQSRIENYCLGLCEGELTVSKKLAQTYMRYSGKLSASDSHVSHSRPTNWKGIWRCSTIFYCVSTQMKIFPELWLYLGRAFNKYWKILRAGIPKMRAFR
jgi:hypothetical protein